jgi:hypothetical protein
MVRQFFSESGLQRTQASPDLCEPELPGPSLCERCLAYDRGSGQAVDRQGRWNNTRGFAWSRTAAGRLCGLYSSQAAAFVVQYDLDVDKLEEVAGGPLGIVTIHRRATVPSASATVYSDDGNRLYYVSMDQHVMRVNLRTRRSEQLPFHPCRCGSGGPGRTPCLCEGGCARPGPRFR